MPVREFYWDGSSWTGGGTGSRDDLVPGTYVPGLTPNTVGLVDPAAVTNVIAGTIISPEVYPRYMVASSYYENTRFECPVFTHWSSPAETTFYNCHFVGLNPQTAQELADTLGTAALGNNDFASGFVNYRAMHMTFIDCTFDNGWWYDQGLSNRYSTLWSAAFHGGNFTWKRCDVKRFVDGVGWAQGPCGIDAYTLIQDSWIHAGFYANNIEAIPGKWDPQSGNNTHTDAFQVNTGRNCEIKYSYLGGTRLHSSQLVDVPYLPGGFTGDDYDNAAIMWQQERNDYGDAGNVAYMNFHDNWFGGGIATVQAVVKNSNTLSNNCFVTNNKVLIRQAGWGQGNSAGYWFAQSTSGTGVVYSGNVQWDGTVANLNGNGVAVPIQNAL